MDEMKINSAFTKNLIAKFVKSVLKKKLGCEIDIQLNGLTAAITDGTAHVHLDVDAELSKGTLKDFKESWLIWEKRS